MGRILKANGFTDKIKPSHWNEGWRKRKHVHISAPDGSILEITYANRYVRIVRSNLGTKEKPFAVYSIVSTKYPTRPKSDFFGLKSEPVYMSESEVSMLINGIVGERNGGT